MLRVFILLIFITNSCKETNVKHSTSVKDIHQLLQKKSTSYIKELRNENIEYPLFVNVEIKKDNPKKDYYEVLIYTHTILLEESEKRPYDFFELDFKGKNIIYYFDNNQTKESSKNEVIYKQLKEKNLIKEHKNITEEEGVFLVNEMESWNLFICKNNLEKIEIVKSSYVLEENEKPKNLCQ